MSQLLFLLIFGLKTLLVAVSRDIDHDKGTKKLRNRNELTESTHGTVIVELPPHIFTLLVPNFKTVIAWTRSTNQWKLSEYLRRNIKIVCSPTARHLKQYLVSFLKCHIQGVPEIGGHVLDMCSIYQNKERISYQRVV